MCTGSAMCSFRFCRGPTPVLAAWLQKPRKATMASLYTPHTNPQAADWELELPLSAGWVSGEDDGLAQKSRTVLGGAVAGALDVCMTLGQATCKAGFSSRTQLEEGGTHLPLRTSLWRFLSLIWPMGSNGTMPRSPPCMRTPPAHTHACQLASSCQRLGTHQGTSTPLRCGCSCSSSYSNHDACTSCRRHDNSS